MGLPTQDTPPNLLVRSPELKGFPLRKSDSGTALIRNTRAVCLLHLWVGSMCVCAESLR